MIIGLLLAYVLSSFFISNSSSQYFKSGSILQTILGIGCVGFLLFLLYFNIKNNKEAFSLLNLNKTLLTLGLLALGLIALITIAIIALK
ncbi:MAG: hypothetical protein JWM09_824 [Francisellaceae bacterium]|nr:hypothetical protein [Francisellaceae bacterium]